MCAAPISPNQQLIALVQMIATHTKSGSAESRDTLKDLQTRILATPSSKETPYLNELVQLMKNYSHQSSLGPIQKAAEEFLKIKHRPASSPSSTRGVTPSFFKVKENF